MMRRDTLATGLALLHAARPRLALSEISHCHEYFQMAHMHEIGGKAGAARGTSTPTTQAAKVQVRPAMPR